jgi:hypothetical protein
MEYWSDGALGIPGIRRVNPKRGWNYWDSMSRSGTNGATCVRYRIIPILRYSIAPVLHPSILPSFPSSLPFQN